MSVQPRYGTGRGGVFPAEEATQLLNPFRRLIHPPARLARRVPVGRDGIVLELGSGPGWFSAALARRVPEGWVHLLDLQPGMLRRARARTSAHGLSATAADAMALPLRSSCADAVVIAAVLGEVPDPLAVLHEAARVLKPTGVLVIFETRTDPDFISFERLREVVAGVGLQVRRRHGRIAGYTAILD